MAKAPVAETTKREDSGDLPLIDSQAKANLKKLIAQGKERGYVTYDELNEALPQEQISSEQIEDFMTLLAEMGVNLIEPDDGIIAIGSGGTYAMAAAKALARHTELGSREIAEHAMGIAASICIYTNANVTIEEL